MRCEITGQFHAWDFWQLNFSLLNLQGAVLTGCLTRAFFAWSWWQYSNILIGSCKIIVLSDAGSDCCFFFNFTCALFHKLDHRQKFEMSPCSIQIHILYYKIRFVMSVRLSSMALFTPMQDGCDVRDSPFRMGIPCSEKRWGRNSEICL